MALCAILRPGSGPAWSCQLFTFKGENINNFILSKPIGPCKDNTSGLFIRQGMFTLSAVPSTNRHSAFLHTPISLFGKSSRLIHVDILPHGDHMYI